MTYLLNIIRCKSATSNYKTELTVFEHYINSCLLYTSDAADE